MRVGVFFDGTGNNLANSVTAAPCFAPGFDLRTAPEAVRCLCARLGYDEQGNTPQDSYGNDKSNVACLYELYQARAGEPLLKVYVQGIGTTAGEPDAALSMLTGRHALGIGARVRWAQEELVRQLNAWQAANPDRRIDVLEFDLFGFSRGAAAARHFANDLAKGAGSRFSALYPGPKRSWLINFIGLFDTVAAVVAAHRADFSPADDRNAGLELALPTGIARKVVQLVARDEWRHNFALTRTDNDIEVPGAHADVGGGYLPRMREVLLLTRPHSCEQALRLADEHSQAYTRARDEHQRNQAQWVQWNLQTQVVSWSQALSYVPKRDLYPCKQVFAAVRGERWVEGGLSRVYLQLMRELGMAHDVPFAALGTQPSLQAPQALQGIATRLLGFALGHTGSPGLGAEEEGLLRQRYIHHSSHWNAARHPAGNVLDAVYIHRPHETGRRMRHDNA
ncbi:phospholipase effector Tle1 domain-containing protein [Pseudomonas sp. BJa5]|uniref:phospholipase effector Tle1 domain-containing protein n=1 Tax=Pseudomonas sp. BJa5 TaxID=2936270 RepID=UPI00255A1EF6|nr:DUF2235 domain-containing protein [Pseudomonas sp. BGr12]MDL2422599.1 DUF2235 domain-containing protein [Pseudomonas sp. BGr12]